MPSVIDHIREKLKRADEHKEQLHREIEAFLEQAPERTVVNADPETAEAFEEYHRNRPIPSRLSVIAGEALYQLRSSLDHLVCALVRYDGGDPRSAQFPITLKRPASKKELGDYERQVSGITRPEVRAAIERLQPYHRPNPSNHWLAVLKTLNNRDKHQALILTVVWPERRIGADMVMPDRDGDMTVTHDQPDEGGELPDSWIDPAGERVVVVNVERRITTSLAFHSWGDGKRLVEVEAGLDAICEGVHGIVAQFEPFLQ